MTESVAQLLSDVSNDSDTEEKESSTPSSAHSRLLNKSTGKTIDLQPKMGRTRAKSSFNFYAKLVKRIEGKVLPDIQAKNSTSSIMTRASPKVVPETTIENGVQVISDRQGTVDHLAPKISGSGEKVLMVLPEEPNGGKHITNGMTLRARATPGDTVTNAKEITETERKMYDRLSRVGTVDLKGLGCLANDCAKRFKSLEALACHFTVMHSNALPSSDCLVCGREFQQRQEVLVHAGSDHKDSMREELEEAFAEELKLVQEAAVQPKLPGKRRKQMVYGSRAGRGKSVKRARRNQSTSNIKSDDLVDYKQRCLATIFQRDCF